MIEAIFVYEQLARLTKRLDDYKNILYLSGFLYVTAHSLNILLKISRVNHLPWASLLRHTH
jgi:hypothetical protein